MFNTFMAAAVAVALAAPNVLVIGVDGLSPAGIEGAQCPNIRGLMARGAYTLQARAVIPTSSSPNWASMIMGAGPEQHGVTSNAWRPEKDSPGGIFPTVFSVARAQRPDAAIGVFHDWDGFGRLLEPEAPTKLIDAGGPRDAVEMAAAFMIETVPILTFVHLDHVDHAGHKHGWGSEEYLAAVRETDILIGDLFAKLQAANQLTKTVVIVTSDHGGIGKSHGGTSIEEIEIPWIIAGPGVKTGATLKKPVDIYDTAATIAHILGLAPHPRWIAKPVLEAFTSTPKGASPPVAPE